MSYSSVPPKVRLLIANWPEDAHRGAVTAFCREHSISRPAFYKIRALVREDGTWKAVEPRSKRPHSSPSRIDAATTRAALEVRAELEAKGLDFGPLSVQAKMRRTGLTPPSRATLARLFTRAGVVKPEPRKKPRSAYRGFVYPAPNCCWQIDATEWTLKNGRTCVIFQIIDDHSRLALASLAASGETSEAAIRVVRTAINRHGAPQKFLSDNGAALNPTRRGREGQLVNFLLARGVEPITGKPHKPTTQGKNERFHQTLFRYLNKQPAAATLQELQAQVDAFDLIYNTEREHQSLAPGMTPQEAWDATPKAPSPIPPTGPVRFDHGVRHVERTVTARGIIRLHRARIQLGSERAGATMHLIYDAHTVDIYDSAGTFLVTHPRPEGDAYITPTPRGSKAEVSTKS